MCIIELSHMPRFSPLRIRKRPLIHMFSAISILHRKHAIVEKVMMYKQSEKASKPFFFTPQTLHLYIFGCPRT